MADDWGVPLSPEEMRATLMYVRFNDMPFRKVVCQAILENFKFPFSVIGIISGIASLGSILGVEEMSSSNIVTAFFDGYRALMSGFFATFITRPFSFEVPEVIQDLLALYLLFVSIAVRDYQVVHAPIVNKRMTLREFGRLLRAPVFVPAQAIRYLARARHIISQQRYMAFSLASFFVNLLATPILLKSGIAIQQLVAGGTD